MAGPNNLNVLSSINIEDAYEVISLESKDERNSKPNEKNHDYTLTLGWKNKFIHDYELPRKIFHSSIGFCTLYLYTQGTDYKDIPFPLEISFIVIFALDVLRFNWRAFNRLYCQAVGILMREKEVNTYNGVLWYLLGLIFSFTFFSKDIAILTVCLLSWCDTLASSFGRAYGHLTPKISKNKSLAGTSAAFITGIGISLLIYGYFIPSYTDVNKPGEIFWTPESSTLNIWQLSILIGFIGALSEAIPLFNWDDNFTIPVLSAVSLHLLLTFTAVPETHTKEESTH